VPPEEENLVLRLLRLLEEREGRSFPVRLILEKHLPPAAGLGGGSSDAAGALLGLSRMFGLPLSPEEAREILARVGSDVPFFWSGGTALARGRGEILEPLPTPRWTAVIAWPRAALSTSAVYRELDRRRGASHTGPSWTEEALRALRLGPEALARSGNDLEETALSLCPSIGELKEALLEAGAPFALLSGSGPAVFSAVREPAEALALARRVRLAGFPCQVAPFISRGVEMV